ncbi:glycoside hydrolase family 43 protein [Yinghuangia aomiensis]|uniref:Glycoside hydrolase family 43 protein n=1 Tax=Yinghuangia aomiensis TaxID=676205 RepID=A0ABP9I8E7_9ACTN
MNVNPIVPGFYPDPSICRVGSDYYLATSSFEYFPGVPLFHSTDLILWEQVGNVLDRAGQLKLPVGPAQAGSGIWAPTLRQRDGLFLMVTTNVTEPAKGHLLVRSTDPAGDWSDPIHTDGAVGFDPDLAWEEDGTCYLTWASASRGILQAQLDPDSGRLLSEPRSLWSGTGLASPEAPHLIARNEWWYLLIAEGGTERGHAVSVARSRSITGPFEGCPANPIFSHRSTTHPVQNAGHADMIELPDGRWAMVYLGVRPRGSVPQFHVNGRETFLAGIDWISDWPVVVEDAFTVPAHPTSFVDNFTGPQLHPRWVSPGVDPATFVRRVAPDATGGVTLLAGRASEAREAERLLAVRARDAAWQAAATVPAGDAALVVRIDDAHWAAVERHGDSLSARMVVGPLDQRLGTVTGVDPDRPLAIRTVDTDDPERLRNGPDRIHLGYLRDGNFHTLADVDGRYLSTEVAGGFTGRVIGVEALGGDAVLRRFEYAAIPTVVNA